MDYRQVMGMWLQSWLLLLMGLQCAASSARVQSCDIGADKPAHSTANTTPHSCAYSCTDGGADCCTKRNADAQPNGGTDQCTYYCTNGQAYRFPHGCANTRTDDNADSCADASPL